MIILGPQQYNNTTTAIRLAADVPHGQEIVRVESAKGFKVGQIVLLDEASQRKVGHEILCPSS